MTELLERLAADVGGRYVIEHELGRGGMATVYLARDLLDERQVAIKVMDPELAAAVGAERFKREIEIASRLQHPNILGILGSGEAAGTSFYVMPFVKGETLRARLDRERQLPMEDAIRIAREVADALDYAHQQGVVHRDIKPENILLEDGRSLVADFGIARAASGADNSTLTKTGTALGTPHYMSPEQVMGDKKDIDGRTDQYALGCMLFEMLAGQPPFVGPHAQSLMAQHVLDEPPYVTRFRASTPSNVEDAILTALAKTKVERFPSMHDFTVALENTGYTSLMKIARKQRETISAAQLEALKPRPPMPLWKKAAIAVGGLALVLGGTAGAWSLVNAKPRSDPTLLAEMQRIAVLYLEPNDGGDVPAFAEGLTEGLITRLRSVKDLTVVSRDGVMPFRGQDVRFDSVAAALDVGTVVTGSVDQSGDQLLVSIQLRDTTGEVVERFSVRQPLSEGYALSEKVADGVAAKLRGLLGDRIKLTDARAGTENAQAWTLFQRGERARHEADSLVRTEQLDASLARLDAADAQLRQAAALDARWSAPVIGRATTALSRAQLAGMQRDRGRAAPWLDSAEALATRALALTPGDAEAYAARGRARAQRVLWDLIPKADAKRAFARAAADLDSATSFDPTLAAAWSMRGRLEYAEKRPEEAKRFTLRAYEADAYLAEAPEILYRLFLTSHDLNNYRDARRYCDEGGRRFPKQGRFVHCRLMVQMMENADSTTAASVWRTVDSLEAMVPPDRWATLGREVQMFAAAALIRADLPDSARRVLDRVRFRDASEDPTGELIGLEAFVRAQLGEREQAIRILERYVADHPQHIAGFRRADFWWWRPLKGDPRFERILELARKEQ